MNTLMVVCMKTFKDVSSRLTSQDDMHLMNEGIPELNKAFVEIKKIYNSGRRYSAKEWFKLMSKMLDDII